MPIGIQELGIRQPNVEVVIARVDESAVGDAALLEGAAHFSYVKNGVGDYTLTLENGVSKRTIVVLGVTPLTAGLIPSIVTVTASAVNVQFEDAAGAATVTDFHIAMLVFHHATEY